MSRLLEAIDVTLTIPAGGTGVTAYAGGGRVGRNLPRGRLIAFKLGTGLTTPTLTITGEDSAVPIMTVASASGWYYPRAIPNKVADGGAFTNCAEFIYVISERIKIVVTNASASETATITFIFEQLEE